MLTTELPYFMRFTVSYVVEAEYTEYVFLVGKWIDTRTCCYQFETIKVLLHTGVENYQNLRKLWK